MTDRRSITEFLAVRRTWCSCSWRRYKGTAAIAHVRSFQLRVRGGNTRYDNLAALLLCKFWLSAS